MNTVTYTKFRQQLAGFLDQVYNDHTPLLVTRQNADPVVVMSLEDFKSYEATFHLLASKNNALRLNAAIEELRAGGGQERELIEE
ncbi:MAG: type II toxin-antitoxin system Phd/YefM family antitoxin [Xenococcaceae cyanobacterium]